MLLRTHFVVAAFVILLFKDYFTAFGDKIIFTLIFLLATALPDIDSSKSFISRKLGIIGKIINFFTKHRGFFHSLTFAIIATIILTFFSISIAIPFFLGYALHLFLDALTIEGIAAFWPSKKRSSWKIEVGSLAENIIFFVFIFLIIIFIVVL